MNTEDAGLESVFNYVAKLATIVMVCKAVVVFMAYNHGQDDIDRLTGDGMSGKVGKKRGGQYCGSRARYIA